MPRFELKRMWDFLLLIHRARQTSDLAAAFTVLQMQLAENGILTTLASGLADDKVEHARGAIKFVAGQAAAIAFN